MKSSRFHSRSLLRKVWFVLAAGGLFPWVQLSAQEPANPPQDKAVIQPGGRISTQLTLMGRIEDYTGEVLKIRLKPDVAPNEYPADDVLEVTTWHGPAYQSALKQIEQKDWARAQLELQTAFAREDRAWVRREILCQMIRCALQQGDYLNASTQFAALIRSDPKTKQLALLPLAWTPQPPTPSLKQQAGLWLRDVDSEAAVKLLAASHLLTAPDQEEAARNVLKTLTTHSDRTLAWLAQAQLWRLRVYDPRQLNPLEFQYWEKRLELLPEELRAGPYYVLGRGYVTRREYELAAAHLLWAPLVGDLDHFLAARACFEAAQSLATIGQYDSAAQLFREVTERFADTPYADTAKKELQQLPTSRAP